jgi:hypothetical protein
MPCYMTGSTDGDRAMASEEEVTRLTRMLCQLCHAMESTEHIRMYEHRAPGLAKWWRDHKAIDAAQEKP